MENPPPGWRESQAGSDPPGVTLQRAAGLSSRPGCLTSRLGRVGRGGPGGQAHPPSPSSPPRKRPVAQATSCLTRLNRQLQQ